MGAFDVPIVPQGLTPGNTAEASLWQNNLGVGVHVLISAVIVSGTSAADASIGILPDGGSSTYWIGGRNVSVSPSNPIVGFGPVYMPPNSTIRVQAGTANVLQFSLVGTQSS